MIRTGIFLFYSVQSSEKKNVIGYVSQTWKSLNWRHAKKYYVQDKLFQLCMSVLQQFVVTQKDYVGTVLNVGNVH